MLLGQPLGFPRDSETLPQTPSFTTVGLTVCPTAHGWRHQGKTSHCLVGEIRTQKNHHFQMHLDSEESIFRQL